MSMEVKPLAIEWPNSYYRPIVVICYYDFRKRVSLPTCVSDLSFLFRVLEREVKLAVALCNLLITPFKIVPFVKDLLVVCNIVT